SVDGQRVDVMIGRAAREHVEGGHVGVGVPAEAGEVGKVKAPGEGVEGVAAGREAGAGGGRGRGGEGVAGLRGVVEIQDADDEAAAQLVVGDGRVGHVLYVAKGAEEVLEASLRQVGAGVLVIDGQGEVDGLDDEFGPGGGDGVGGHGAG